MRKKQLMVRVCPDCGTVYGESKKICEQCGVRLDDPVPQSEGLEQGDDIHDKKRRRAYIIANNRGDVAGDYPDINPGIELDGFRITFGTLAAISLPVLIALTVITFGYMSGSRFDWLVEYLPGLPELVRGKFFFLALPAIGLMGYTVFECFAPNAFWILSMLAESLNYDRVPKPSDFYFITNAIFEVVATILTYIYLIVVISMLL